MSSPGSEFFDQTVADMRGRQNDTLARLSPLMRRATDADLGSLVGTDGARLARVDGDVGTLDDGTTIDLNRLQRVAGEQRAFHIRPPRDADKSDAHRAMNSGLRAAVGTDDGFRAPVAEDPTAAAERELAEARLAVVEERAAAAA
jgi:hypothetical protein